MRRLDTLAIAVALLIWDAAVAQADTRNTAAADFLTFCAPCHGASAKGDGPAGSALRVRPPDLTAIAQRHGGTFPELEIFETIAGLDMPDSHGSRDMPVWGDLFVSEAVGGGVSIEDAKRAADETEARITNLMKYLEEIQAKAE